MNDEAETLESLVSRFTVLALNSTLRTAEMAKRFPQHPVSRLFFPTGEMAPLADRIIKRLKNTSRIKDCADLADILTDEWVLDLQHGGTVTRERLEGITGRIFARLDDPLRTFSFSTPISTLSPYGFGYELGGPEELAIGHTREGDEAAQMVLVGRVRAISERRATAKIELHVKHLLGLTIAVGLAEPYVMRLASLPKTRIEGGIEEEIELDPSVSGLAAMTVFQDPSQLDELTLRRVEQQGLESVVTGLLDRVKLVMNSNEEHGRTLRSAARLFFDATASFDAGKAVAFALMSIEAVLLERDRKSDILARLREAVAFRLGGTPRERKELRENVDSLYSARSSFVHTGQVENSEASREKALNLVRKVISREVRDFARSSAQEEQGRNG